jgi:hypothetical protein
VRGQYRLRKARKEHTCTEWASHTIRVGDVYLYGSCPPEHEMNRTGKKWEYIRACLRCAKEYGLHTESTRKQLETLS